MKTLVLLLSFISSVTFAQIQDPKADQAEIGAFISKLCSSLAPGDDTVNCYKRGQEFYKIHRPANSTESLMLFKSGLALTVCTFDNDPYWEQKQLDCIKNSELLVVHAGFHATQPQMRMSFFDPSKNAHPVRIYTCNLVTQFAAFGFNGVRVDGYGVNEIEYRLCLTEGFSELHQYLVSIESLKVGRY